MVLGSAQYKRQHDLGGADSPMGGGGEDDARVVHSERELFMANQAPPPISTGSSMRPRPQTLSDSNSTEHLSMVADGGGDGVGMAAMNSAGSLHDSGGHVRFVDSTIRIHPGSRWAYWNSRSVLEKVLIVLTLTLAAFSTIMLLIVTSNVTHSRRPLRIMTHYPMGDGDDDDGSGVCLTPDCVKVAANILTSADLSADPCEDFYQYSCGGWETLNPIPDGRTSWSTFEKLWEMNQLAMRNSIESSFNETTLEVAAGGDVDDDAKKKVYVYYRACLDPNGTIEGLGGKPLLDSIADIGGGGWRILANPTNATVQDGNATERDAGLIKTLEDFQAKLEILQHGYQSGGFFSWMVTEDDKNSSRHIIQVDQGGLSLPNKDYYLKNDTDSNKVVAALRELIVDVAKLLIRDGEGVEQIPKEREADIRRQAQDIVDFEILLANITINDTDRRDEEQLYHKMNLTELHKNASFLDWTRYFNSAFQSVDKVIDSGLEVVNYAPVYLRNLTTLIESYLKGDRRKQVALENYLVWQLVKGMRNTLSQKYRDTGKKLEKAIFGKESHHERWRLCITDTDSVFGFALGSLFIEKSFNGRSKPVAQAMIDDVKAAFKQRLGDAEWMDAGTKRAALVKLEAITDMIGYPDYIKDDWALDDKYAKLTVVDGDYFHNSVRFHKFTFEENLAKLEKAVNRTKWSMTPPQVNAYYTPTKNQIVFPAGILQMPFFSLQYPRSINYGAIGVVMGHELSHAFDDQGREFDEVGNMRDWWNNATKLKFKERIGCMETQYSGYNLVEPNVNVSGAKTIGENIADNGGLKAAYTAYEAWKAEATANGTREALERPLPGLSLNHNQLFFLSFSQVWCSKSTPQSLKLQVLNDPHSPARFRVIGVLSNSKEFSEAFQCEEGSKMNPKHKCEVW